MGNASDDIEVVCKGPKYRILFVKSKYGGSARAFIDQLEHKQKIKLKALLDHLVETGQIRNTQKFRHEQGKIWALKQGQIRIYCFQDGTDWLLTNGCIKKQDKADPKELERAENSRIQYLRIK